MLPQSATQVFRRKMVCRCTISTDFPLYVSRHGLSDEKGCVAVQIQLISLYLCRDTPFLSIFHVSREGLLAPYTKNNQCFSIINHCAEPPAAEIYLVRQHKLLKSVHLIERYTCLHLCTKESCTRFQANEHMNVHYIA